MICRVEEAKHEMESRLDSQRRHMVQKESILQNEIEELKVNTILFFFSFVKQSSFLLFPVAVSYFVNKVSYRGKWH